MNAVKHYMVDIVYDIYHIIDNEGYFDDFAPQREASEGGIPLEEEEGLL